MPKFYINDFDFTRKILHVEGYGSTQFFNDEDVEWLSNGGIPALNKQGYMIMPQGHFAGPEVYPELFGKEDKTVEEDLDDVASAWDIDE